MDLNIPVNWPPILIHWDRGITHIKATNLCQEMTKDKRISGKDQNLHVKPKQLQKHPPICQNIFQEKQKIFSSARKVKIFFKKLRKGYIQSNNPKHRARLFFRLFWKLLTRKKNTNKGKIKPKLGKTVGIGGKTNAREGCHKKLNSLPEPVCQPSFFNIKEGWRINQWSI